MLVLSRKLEEAIMIGDDIEVVVLAVEGETVKLGIRAPKQVEIYRKELYEDIVSTNKQSVMRAEQLNRLKGLYRP